MSVPCGFVQAAAQSYRLNHPGVRVFECTVQEFLDRDVLLEARAENALR